MVTGRTLVLVVGPPDSETGLVARILEGLGYHAPPVAEVAELHDRLLARARVGVADARPAAWAATAEVGLDSAAEQRLRAWLERRLAANGDIVVADPRLPWFLPLWRRAADAAGAPPRVVALVRHPAAAVGGENGSSGGWERAVGRAAGWLNHTLYVERATREGPRAVVREADLLDDWPRTIGRVGEALDLAVVRDAPAFKIRGVHRFLELGAAPPAPGWGERRIPAALQALLEETWTLVSRLADDPAGDPERLDAVRAAYVELYRDAEALTQSSRAAGRGEAAPPALRARVARRVPRRVRDMVPVRWRRRAARALRAAP